MHHALSYFHVKEVQAGVNLDGDDMMTTYYMTKVTTFHRLAILHVSSGETRASGHTAMLWEEEAFQPLPEVTVEP